MLSRRFQVKNLSVDELVAVIATVAGQKLLKAKWLLLDRGIVWRGRDRCGHKSTLASQCV
jgi:hypothetical protein